MIPFLYEWRLHKSRIENLFRPSANNSLNVLKSNTFITVYQHVSVKWQAKLRPMVSRKENPVPNPSQRGYDYVVVLASARGTRSHQRATDKKQLELFVGLMDRDMCGVDLINASASWEDPSGQYVLTSNSRSQPNGVGAYYDEDPYYYGNNSSGRQGSESSQAEDVFITVRIQVRIHPSVFTSFIEKLKNFPALDPTPQWLRTMFKQVETNVPSAKNRQPGQPAYDTELFSDIKLVSEDGREFHCHKMVLGRQSNVLAAMLSNSSTTECKEGVLRFPTLDGKAVHTLLKFLYLGEIKYGKDMGTDTILQLLDTAEQYALQNLKTFCAAALWRRVVETPEKATEIFVAANTYQLEFLKTYVLGVLVENYDFQQEKKKLRNFLNCNQYDEVLAHAAGRVNVSSQRGSGQEGVLVRVVVEEQEWLEI